MQLVLLIIAVSASYYGLVKAETKHFYGHQVIRAETFNDDQFKVLLKMQLDHPALDFWSGPTPQGADILIDPEMKSEVEGLLQANKISFKTLIPDVEKVIAEQRKQAQALIESGRAEFWESYQGVNEIFAWMDQMAAQFPGIVTIQSIGNSTKGRPLRLMKLSTGGAARKPSIFIDGTFHAREFISPATVTYMINELLLNASQHEDILDGVDLYVLPISNPDGYEYAHTVNRLWRKTVSENAGSTCIGKDLNRNFNYRWGGVGTSPDPCSNNYPGPFPCSEPECQAISQFILNTNVNWWGYVSFHSASQMWLTPWGYTEEVPFDHSDMMAMGIKATNALTRVHGVEYRVGPSSTTIYFTSGTSQDWARGVAGIKYSITVELRDTGEFGHLLPPEQIIPSGEETFEALKVMTREVIRQARCEGMADARLVPNYSPLGNITIVNGMDTYETPDKSPKTMIIVVYDIYGFTPTTRNIYQIADKFAESGVRVAMPDFFRGEPWKRAHYPYPTDEEFYNFVRATSWDESVREDLIEVLAHYKQEGITEFGIIGFCFGGKIVAHATGEFYDDIKVGAQFHPAGMNLTDASLIRAPVIILPGSNDPDHTEYCQIIKNNLGDDACSYTHFRDVNHGYAGGVADWSNLIIRGRAEEATNLARNFFCEKLK